VRPWTVPKPELLELLELLEDPDELLEELDEPALSSELPCELEVTAADLVVCDWSARCTPTAPAPTAPASRAPAVHRRTRVRGWREEVIGTGPSLVG
jgi:hypothetical protein